MSEIEDFIIGVASQLLDALEPLPRLARSESEFADVLTQLGWPVDPADDLAGVRAPFDIGNVLTDARYAIAGGDLTDPVVVLAAASSVSDIVAFVRALTTGPADMATLPAPFDTAAFWSVFPNELFQMLLIRTVERSQPAITALLGVVGGIDEYDVPAAAPRLAYRARVLDFGKFAAFLADPVTHLQTEFGWGDNRVLDQDRVLTRLHRLASLLGPARIGAPRDGAATPYWSPTAPGRPALRQLTATLFESYNPVNEAFAAVGVSALPIPAKNTPAGPPVGVALQIDAAAGGSIGVSIDLGPLVLAIEGGLQAQGSLVVDLRPDSIDGRLAGVSATFDAAVALQRNMPLLLLGSPTGMRLEVDRFEFRLAVSGEPSDLEFIVSLMVQKLAFVIQASSADSFLGKFLGTNPQSVTLDLEIVASTKKGVRLAAGGGFRFVISAHLDLILLRIETITIELLARTGSAIVLNLSVDVVLTLGPVTATVSKVGARLLATPRGADDPPGNLGALDLGFGFKPPDGAGLLVEASIVKGGGYALFDFDAGQYAGILQLSIKEIITITAIGLIATKMPDGSKGFSLLVILTAEFPPIQLSMGFTLSGLGGIFGFNRTMAVEPLRAGARTGALDSILFPPDPLKNIPKVLSDLQSIFPVSPGRFVIGLMVRIGWGSNLITVDLGVIIVVPEPIVLAILGRVTLLLPQSDDAVVELRLDIVGILDFGRGEISIDASLRDSRIAVFTLTGDIAVRIGWGATKIFAVSAGGFNPRFSAPGGFPALRRLALSLATSDNPRLRLETYFALTSNSVQIGAKVDIYAELDTGFLGVFSACAYLGFDALVIFDPFGFVVDIYGGVDIRRNGKSILSASVLLSLSGPTPWRASGYAEVIFLGTHRIPIEVTMGEEPPPLPPPAVDPTADLVAALADKRNWMAQLPDVANGVVTLREFESPNVLAHPLGTIGVRQRVVPLEIAIDIYNGAPVVDAARRFALTFAIGGASVDATRTAIREDLAPGLFFAMSDDEKLSRPAFEPLICGYSSIAAPPLQSGPAVAGADEYETRIVDEPEEVPGPLYVMHGTVVGAVAGLGAAAQAPSKPRYDGPVLGIAVAPQSYSLAAPVDLAAAGAAHVSFVEADAARRQAGTATQVVGSQEVAA